MNILGTVSEQEWNGENSGVGITTSPALITHRLKEDDGSYHGINWTLYNITTASFDIRETDNETTKGRTDTIHYVNNTLPANVTNTTRIYVRSTVTEQTTNMINRPRRNVETNNMNNSRTETETTVTGQAYNVTVSVFNVAQYPMYATAVVMRSSMWWCINVVR